MTHVSVLFGPPGAGKGTQANLLATRLNAIHISTGNLIRQEIASQSDLGKRVKEVVEAGHLIDDDLLFECFSSCLEKAKENSFLLLDGVPRTVTQVELLDKALADLGLKVNSVFYVNAEPEKLVERFSKRWTCRKCSFVASFVSEVDAAGSSCPQCGEKDSFYRRKDDAPDAVRTRFSVYENETAPVLDIYKKRSLVVEVDGLLPIEHVYVKLASRLLL